MTSSGTGPEADGTDRPVRVLCWSERTEPEAVYPQGINGAIAPALEEAGGFEARDGEPGGRRAGAGRPGLGGRPGLVRPPQAPRGARRERAAHRGRGAGAGAGLRPHPLLPRRPPLPPHARATAGGSAGWREDGCPSVVSVVQPDHPIAPGLDRIFVIPMEEMYAEPFAIKPPDELVFISSFAGGEVLRSGCCWHAGRGARLLLPAGARDVPGLLPAGDQADHGQRLPLGGGAHARTWAPAPGGSPAGSERGRVECEAAGCGGRGPRGRPGPEAEGT